jgi:zinc/manganese transport system ATP-binding protein
VTAVLLRGVSLGFAGRNVLENVNIELRQGEFVGLLGPNGAGKTTLLRALLGLHRPAAGRIDILGAPARPGRAHVGYLPQTTAASLPPVTGRDLLAASLQGAAWGLPRSGAGGRTAIHDALAAVDAVALADRPITKLSGGERQRVFIAQALLGQPRLLLLDEPLAGLDPLNQHAVARLLRDVQTRLGLTVLCSAHDLNVVLPVADRVLYLGGGHAALGAVDEVVNRATLSRLYGGPIDVVRAAGRIFVVSGAAVAGPAA